MERLITYLSAAIAICTWFVPQIKLPTKVNITVLLLLLMIFFLFRKSKYYLHKKYFDERNLFIFCEELLLALREGDVFYYKYVLVVGSRYSDGINVDDLQVIFNTTASIISYDILLCDFDQNLLRIEARDYSTLEIKLEKLEAWDVFAIGIDCKLDFKEDYPFIDSKDLEYYNVDANLKGNYRFFKKDHPFSKNIKLTTSPAVWQKNDILFDIVRVLDLRKTTTSDRLSSLGRFISEDETKTVKLFGLMDKSLLAEYNDSKKIIQYKSSKPISFLFYPIRIVISKKNDVGIVCSLGPFNRYEP